MEHNITFCFIETGSVFIKDGKTYHLPSKKLQSQMAWKSGMSFQGKPISWELTDSLGLEIAQEHLYTPRFDLPECKTCGSRLICNGSSSCASS
jgi:hypothetical protein